MSFGGPFQQKIKDATEGTPAASRGANAQTAMVAAAGNNGLCTPTPTPTPTPASGGGGGGDGTEPVPTPTPALDSVHLATYGQPNNDVDPEYPAAYESPNLISVANTDDADVLHCSSSYGKFSVDLAAPGINVVSTLNAQSAAATPPSPYNYLSGTSMSAPHVSGTFALVRETFPSSTTAEVLDRVRMGVDILPSLSDNLQPGQLRDYKGKVSTGGRLNAYRALLPRSKLANVSCRAKTETGNGIVINGFILRAETKVLIRGIGPSLTSQGVAGALADPVLQLFDPNGAFIQDNNNWKRNV